VPAAVRGPVVGPECRACVSESERGWGWQGGASASFLNEVRWFARRKTISAGIVCDDPDLWRGGAYQEMNHNLYTKYSSLTRRLTLTLLEQQSHEGTHTFKWLVQH
jgi:hypothetical protein